MRVKLGSLDVKARDSVQRKLAQGRNISRSVPQPHRAAPSTAASIAHESSGRANALLEPNLEVIENRVTTCRDWGSAPAVGLNGLTFLMVPPRVEVSVFVVLSVFVFLFFLVLLSEEAAFDDVLAPQRLHPGRRDGVRSVHDTRERPGNGRGSVRVVPEVDGTQNALLIGF